ncbi:MAG: aminomethyltransferase family protein [Dehalococcoidia bacterium]
MTDTPETPFTSIIRKACSPAASWMVFNGHQFADVVVDRDVDVAAGRAGVAMQDVSPMMKYVIKGKDAGRFLDNLSTRRLSHLAIGRVAYFLMADPLGRVRDDGTVFRMADDEFLVQSGTDLSDWMERHRSGFDVRVAAAQTDWAEMSVFGPKTAAFLKAAGISGLETLKAFNFMRVNYAGVDLYVSRTGFTGGLGYELLIPWTKAAAVLQSLLESPLGGEVVFVGNHTGVTLRLDIGFLIPSWDFPVPRDGEIVDPARYRTPYDMGWDWLVELDHREDFIGKAALVRIKQEGPTYCYLALVFDDPVDAAAMVGAAIHTLSGERIGEILVCGYSPTVGHSVGLANVRSGRGQAGDSVTAGDGQARGTLRPQPLVTFPERVQVPPPGI